MSAERVAELEKELLRRDVTTTLRAAGADETRARVVTRLLIAEGRVTLVDKEARFVGTDGAPIALAEGLKAWRGTDDGQMLYPVDEAAASTPPRSFLERARLGSEFEMPHNASRESVGSLLKRFFTGTEKE